MAREEEKKEKSTITPAMAAAELDRRKNEPSGNVPADKVSAANITPQLAAAELERRNNNVQDVPDLQDLFGNNAVTNLVIAPLAEVARGLYKHSASFTAKLDASTKLLENVSGGRINRGGFFEDAQRGLDKYAQEIPDTNMGIVPKTVYEMVGGFVPIASEFALADRILGVVGVSGKLKAADLDGLTETAKFGLLGAMDAYSKTEDYRDLLRGAARGAAFQMSFGLAAKAAEISYKFGKGAVRNFITWLSDKKTAKAFVDNPEKFNMNMFGKTRTPEEVMAENKIRKTRLDKKFDREKAAFKENARRRKEILDSELGQTRFELNASLKESKDALAKKGEASIERVAENTSKTIKGGQQALHADLVSTYDDTLKTYNTLKKEAGDNVSLAIDSTLKQNPKASVPVGKVTNRVNKVIRKYAPFRKVKGEFVPRTAGANANEARVFNNIMKEIRSRSKEGTISIGYLQSLKEDVRVLANRAYASGNSRLGKMYQELAKEINPATIVSADKALSKNLKLIAEANKTYNTLLPKYEQAMRKCYKMDSQGNFAPDIEKALKAISKQDIVALREMELADSMLPKDARLLPKIRKMAAEYDNLVEKQNAINKNVLKTLKREKKELEVAARKSINNINKNQKLLKEDERRQAIKRVQRYMEQKDAEYVKSIENMEKAEEFAKMQELIRSVRPSERGGARFLQNILGFGTIPAIKFGGAKEGALALAGVAALSPAIVGLITKPALIASRAGNNLMQTVLKDTTFQEVLGAQLAEGIGPNRLDQAINTNEHHEFTKDKEAFRPNFYDDGDFDAIGYGFNLGNPLTAKTLPQEVIDRERPLTRAEADRAFPVFYADAEKKMRNFAGSKAFEQLNDNTQNALIDLAYTMAPDRLATFEKLKQEIKKGDTEGIVREIKDSHWYRTHKIRGNRLFVKIRRTE